MYFKIVFNLRPKHVNMSWSGPNSTDRKIYLSEMRSVSKHMVVGRGKKLGPVLKQNTQPQQHILV